VDARQYCSCEWRYASPPRSPCDDDDGVCDDDEDDDDDDGDYYYVYSETYFKKRKETISPFVSTDVHNDDPCIQGGGEEEDCSFLLSLN